MLCSRYSFYIYSNLFSNVLHTTLAMHNHITINIVILLLYVGIALAILYFMIQMVLYKV